MEYVLVVEYEDGTTKTWPITQAEIEENTSRNGSDIDWDVIYGERNPCQYGEVTNYWGKQNAAES